MKNYITLGVFLLTCLGSSSAVADKPAASSTTTSPSPTFDEIFYPKKSRFPEGCNPANVEFREKEIIIGTSNDNKQHVFMLANTAAYPIVLNHNRVEPGAGAGWSSKLEPQKWSALALDRPNFNLSCLSLKPQALAYINCGEAIIACNFSDKITFGAAGGGSYWVAENESLENVLKAVNDRGFKLPAAPKNK